jgi:hypothetical protein
MDRVPKPRNSVDQLDYILACELYLTMVISFLQDQLTPLVLNGDRQAHAVMTVLESFRSRIPQVEYNKQTGICERRETFSDIRMYFTNLKEHFQKFECLKEKVDNDLFKEVLDTILSNKVLSTEKFESLPKYEPCWCTKEYKFGEKKINLYGGAAPAVAVSHINCTCVRCVGFCWSENTIRHEPQPSHQGYIQNSAEYIYNELVEEKKLKLAEGNKPGAKKKTTSDDSDMCFGIFD